MKTLFACFVTLALVAYCMLPLSGCARQVQALPPWAVTAPQATAGSIIAGANATVVQYEADVKGGYLAPAAMRTAMQAIQKALTIAQPQYDMWAAELKANPQATEPADLAAALSTLQTTLAQLPALTH
jgi:hypothetical protein